MSLSLTEFSLHDPWVPILVVDSVDTTYTYIADVYLNDTSTNLENLITFPVSIYKPVGEAVVRFTVSLMYRKSLFPSVVITDNILTPANQTTVTSIDVFDTTIVVVLSEY